MAAQLPHTSALNSECLLMKAVQDQQASTQSMPSLAHAVIALHIDPRNVRIPGQRGVETFPIAIHEGIEKIFFYRR